MQNQKQQPQSSLSTATATAIICNGKQQQQQPPADPDERSRNGTNPGIHSNPEICEQSEDNNNNNNNNNSSNNNNNNNNSNNNNDDDRSNDNDNDNDNGNVSPAIVVIDDEPTGRSISGKSTAATTTTNSDVNDTSGSVAETLLEVASPEIFAGCSNAYQITTATITATTTTTTTATITETDDDDLFIENSDPTTSKQAQSDNIALPADNQKQRKQKIQNPGPSVASTSSNTDITDTRPPKKRFMPSSSVLPSSNVPYIRPLYHHHYQQQNSQYQQHPSAFVEPLKSPIQQFPSGEQFQYAMNQWEWVLLDGLKMPVIFRGTDRYAAVHIVQLKLLSKFPPNIPPEMANKFMMISHKMLPIEAWIFNTINAVLCKFDLGCQLFTANDEIVRLVDVERFYWSVKALNLSRMIEIYDNELRNATSTHLMAAITQMRQHVENNLQEVEKELLLAQANATTTTTTTTNTSSGNFNATTTVATAGNFASPGSIR